MSFGGSFRKRQYELNRIVFWSKFSIKTIWDEPYSLLIKIFQKDYFLPYPDFSSSVRSNFPRQYGSARTKRFRLFKWTIRFNETIRVGTPRFFIPDIPISIACTSFPFITPTATQATWNGGISKADPESRQKPRGNRWIRYGCSPCRHNKWCWQNFICIATTIFFDI